MNKKYFTLIDETKQCTMNCNFRIQFLNVHNLYHMGGSGGELNMASANVREPCRWLCLTGSVWLAHGWTVHWNRFDVKNISDRFIYVCNARIWVIYNAYEIHKIKSSSMQFWSLLYNLKKKKWCWIQFLFYFKKSKYIPNKEWKLYKFALLISTWQNIINCLYAHTKSVRKNLPLSFRIWCIRM